MRSVGCGLKKLLVPSGKWLSPCRRQQGRQARRPQGDRQALSPAGGSQKGGPGHRDMQGRPAHTGPTSGIQRGQQPCPHGAVRRPEGLPLAVVCPAHPRLVPLAFLHPEGWPCLPSEPSPGVLCVSLCDF